MQLATGSTDYAAGSIGLVELAASFLQDREKRTISGAEWKMYANLSQKDLAAEINRYHKEYWLTYADTTTAGDQAYYALPDDLVHLMGLEYADDATDRDHRKIVEVVFKDKDFYERLEQANEKLNLGFFFIAGTTFRLAPEVATGGAADGGILRVHYVRRITELVDDEDESEIPDQHHHLIAMQMARYSYIKFNRNNSQLETMYMEGLKRMQRELRQRSPIRDSKTQPFFGSFGPVTDTTRRRLV